MKATGMIRCAAVLTGAVLPLALMAEPAATTARPPNVIVIITDDQGYGDLGAHGHPLIRTPQLDRLHGESARFTNFHVDPTCSPTRAALLTGRYSTRTGVWHTIMGRSLLAPDEVTLPDLFRRAGYRTALSGKWHLGDNFPLRPQDRGFQEVLSFGGGGIGQTPDHWGNDYFDDTYRHNGVPESFSGYCTDVFFAHALRFIEAHRDQPFFLLLATNAAHRPLRVPERYSRPHEECGVPAELAAFYGMIENFDGNLGRLRGCLVTLGLADNTILLFLTDNGTGESAVAGAGPGYNAGMRGGKGTAYDGGHRVPLFIHWPAGGLGTGRDLTALTAHLDLLPTLAEWCGLPLPAGRMIDGRSLAPLLRPGRTEWPERTLFVHVQREQIPPKWRQSAVMTDRWRLVNGAELYDLPADPGQQSNVAAAHPATVAALRASYETWWESLAPALARNVRPVIGAAENPARLTCHDWQPTDGAIPWDQPQVAADPHANGIWLINVAVAGQYRFTLRRRPAEASLPLAATTARVRVGDHETSVVIAAGDHAATLDLTLPAGPTSLQTWLVDAAGNARGAFYVEAHRLD